MWSIIASVGIALALLVTHFVYGWGCWGLQPGGTVSSKLYLLQLIIAAPLANMLARV